MTPKNRFRDTVLFILGVFAASYVLQCLLYPDIWFTHTRRLLPAFDTEVPLDSTFILVSQFFHGGIQLWDRFDQVNYAFFANTNGMYGVVNILTALIYIILSPLLPHQAEALYYIHMVFFYGLTSLIRITGGYLLLRKLVSERWVIFVSLLFLNTIMTSTMMTPGLEWEGGFSFLLLLTYFIFCFFEEPRLRTFLCAALVMLLCLVNSPYYALGYFYQAVHFFILSCAGYFVLRRGWRGLRGRRPAPRIEILKNIGIAACCFLIVLPYFWWGHALTHDFYIHGSGLTGTQGRFNNIFNFKGYFNTWGKAYANSFEFIGTTLDYHHNVWRISWSFIGASVLFFSLAGLVLSKDRRKWIFASAVFLVILVNNAFFPGDFSLLAKEIIYATQTNDHDTLFWTQGMRPHDWGTYSFLMLSTLAHGINLLTNPFSFLVRSFHMVSVLLPTMFLPLVAIGLDSCLCLWQRRRDAIHFNRRWFLTGFTAFVCLWALWGGTKTLSVGLINQDAAQTLKEYILCMGTIFFTFTLAPEFLSAGTRWVGWVILAAALTMDFMALTAYVKEGYDTDYQNEIRPLRVSPCYTHHAVLLDFPNPRLLPWREFINVESRDFLLPGASDFFPSINGGLLCMYGAVYQYTPMGRFFHRWTIYEPRHISYKYLYPDVEAQQYLAGNQRVLFFADYGFDARYLGLGDILHHGLSQRVVSVTPDSNNLPFLKTKGNFYLPPPQVQDRIYTTSLDWKNAQVHQVSGGWEYTFDLPQDFPGYLSTTVFTNDYNSWKLTATSRGFDPIQGKLTTPYTFDVQNIQAKKLTVLLPGPQTPAGGLMLQVKLPRGILNVWKNTYDDLGMTFEAPRDGWLVFNYPYDEKWELTIDGHKTYLSQVNRYFMGAPIPAGDHNIRLRYWPRTSLRFWILMSMTLSMLGFGGILFYGIKREPI